MGIKRESQASPTLRADERELYVEGVSGSETNEAWQIARANVNASKSAWNTALLCLHGQILGGTNNYV